MSRSLFFLIAGIGALGFGGLMFFAPTVAAQLPGIELGAAIFSVLHGIAALSLAPA